MAVIRDKIRTYSELISIPSFEDRFNYLKLSGNVGLDTFGFDRYINQMFYRSVEWRSVRNYVIVRDSVGDHGLDLAHEDHIITGRLYVHHMNPLEVIDFELSSDYLLNPEYLILCSHNTHNAIHYGDVDLLEKDFVERSPNDTCLWKK